MANIIIKSADNETEHQHINIDGYRGKWSAIEYTELDSGNYYIYEHDTWGDETCYLVVRYIDEEPMDIYETYDGIEQCLIDEDII